MATLPFRLVLDWYYTLALLKLATYSKSAPYKEYGAAGWVILKIWGFQNVPNHFRIHYIQTNILNLSNKCGYSVQFFESTRFTSLVHKKNYSATNIPWASPFELICADMSHIF